MSSKIVRDAKIPKKLSLEELQQFRKNFPKNN